MTRIVPVLLVMAAVVGAGVSTQAQRPFPPKSFENLQVLAKGSSTSDVINTMKGFTGALGVRCQHCHVGKEGSPLDQFDFVSDEVPAKKTARLMMRMMADVNRQLDESLPKADGAGARVSCQTCHRGQAKP
jgi:hypothetical protein